MMSLQYYIPFLNFFLPENSSKKIYFTLQSLSISALTKSRGLFELYVKNIPPSLFPIILQTLIHQCYRKFQKERINFQADSIYSIVHFWPYEVLVLREHLKITDNLGIYEGCDFFRVNHDRFLLFFEELIKTMVQAFIFEKVPFNVKKRRIRRLDVSGFGVTVQGMLLRYSKELRTNEELRSRMQSNIYELVCDVSLQDSSDIEVLRLCEGLESDQRSYGLKVECESIALPQDRLTLSDEEALIKLYKQGRPKFTELHLANPTRFLKDIIEAFPKTLEGLRMSYSLGVQCPLQEVQFISQFHNLYHLDLSGTIVRGGWSILGDLKRGLTCLRLSGCRVLVTDFPFLHPHSESLELIDLSNNSFNTDEAFSALSSFICSLKKVQVIELESCNLHRVRSSLFALFLIHFVKGCPKAKVLRLFYNGFSRRILLEHLVALGAKESLRVLSLSFPSESYTHDDYNVIQKSLCSLKERFNEKVEEFANWQLKVEWKEDMSLAHWFYYDAEYALGED